jgi:uncharacterized membrane protein
VSKVVQFPHNRFVNAIGWPERLLTAGTYAILGSMVLFVGGLFSGQLFPFIVAGLLYYALFHHRRVPLAQSSFVRFHLLQALIAGTTLKMLLALIGSALAFLMATLALVQLSFELPTGLWLYVGWAILGAIAMGTGFGVVNCLLGRRFTIRWVSDWVNRTI